MGMVRRPGPDFAQAGAGVHGEKGEVGKREGVQVLDGRCGGIAANRSLLPPHQARNLGKARVSVQRLHEERKARLSFAGDAEIRVLEGLFGKEAHVGTPEDYGDAPAAKLVGDGICVGCGRGDRRYPHEIRLDAPSEDLLALHEQGLGLVSLVAHDRGKEDASQPGKLELRENVQVVVLRLDERNPSDHRNPPKYKCSNGFN